MMGNEKIEGEHTIVLFSLLFWISRLKKETVIINGNFRQRIEKDGLIAER